MIGFHTSGALAAAALVASATLANAASARDPVISEARANDAQTQLIVIGSDLPTTGQRLTLGIGTAPLVVTFATPTRIEALLPAGIEPGTYLLWLTGPQAAGSGAEGPRGDEFWVTLGAMGPTGAPGVVGPQGAPGATGPAGATGPQGPIGPAGAPGSPGATGPRGITGSIGPQGPAGSGGTPTTFVVTARAVPEAGVELVHATAVARCPTGSVITAGYTETFGTWTLVRAFVAENAWHQIATATLNWTPEHFVDAYAICLRIS